MSNIQLVVFDIAGTTVKDNGEITVAFQRALHDHGYDIPAERIKPLMGYKKPEAIKMMLEEYEEDEAMIKAEYINTIHERFLGLMIKHYETATDLEPLSYAEETFAWLKSKGIKIGLDTGFSSDITNVIISRLGWLKDGKVDIVVSSDEVPTGRPAPYMIQKMMRALAVTDTTAVVKLGDTEVDVNEGKNAGCLLSIAVTTGAFTRAQLEPYKPSFIIDSLQQLQAILQPYIN